MTPDEHQQILDSMTPEQRARRQVHVDAILKATRGSVVRAEDWRVQDWQKADLGDLGPPDSHDEWRELNQDD